MAAPAGSTGAEETLEGGGVAAKLSRSSLQRAFWQRHETCLPCLTTSRPHACVAPPACPSRALRLRRTHLVPTSMLGPAPMHHARLSAAPCRSTHLHVAFLPAAPCRPHPCHVAPPTCMWRGFRQRQVAPATWFPAYFGGGRNFWDWLALVSCHTKLPRKVYGALALGMGHASRAQSSWAGRFLAESSRAAPFQLPRFTA